MAANLEPGEKTMTTLQRNFTLLMICLCGVMVFLGVLAITLANNHG